MQDINPKTISRMNEPHLITVVPSTQQRHHDVEELKRSILAHQARVDAARDSGEMMIGENVMSMAHCADLHPGFSETPRGIRLGTVDDLKINLSLGIKYRDYEPLEDL